MANREEELQKKREEAERKARRGEIDPTHEFTFQVPNSSWAKSFFIPIENYVPGKIYTVMDIHLHMATK